VKTMSQIVKQAGYVSTPEAQKALAVVRKAVDDARTERRRAR
jgi:hypothetical protein